jgi:Holliday junction DNA helicase RuvA
MISRLEGTLERMTDGVAEVRCGDLWYAVLVPGCDRQRLGGEVGRRITLHTMHYLEGSAQGANFVPRLIGFASPRERRFFEIFTTVKGVGNRKALRALQLPFGRIARGIAEKDVKLLQTLPEIGKRMAETIVAELHGKIDEFVEGDADARREPDAAPDPRRRIADEALAVLLTLGEPRLEMIQLIDRALAADGQIDSSQDLITAVYRLRELPV